LRSQTRQMAAAGAVGQSRPRREQEGGYY